MIEVKSDYVTTILGHHTRPLIIAGNSHNNLKIWDKESKESITLDVANIYELSISPNGKYLVASTEEEFVKIYDFDSKNLIQLHFDYNSLYDTAWNNSSSLFAMGCEESDESNSVRINDAETGVIFKKLTGHTKSIYTVASHPTEEKFASGSNDGSIRIWSWTGDCINTINLYDNLKIPDSTITICIDVLKSSHNYLLSCSYDLYEDPPSKYDMFIRIWSWTTGECLRVINTFYGGFDVNNISWQDNTLLLHHCLFDGTISKGKLHVWDTSLHPSNWSEIAVIKNVQCATFDNENNIVVSRYFESNNHDVPEIVNEEDIEEQQNEDEQSDSEDEHSETEESEHSEESESEHSDDEHSDDGIPLYKKHGYNIIIYESCFAKSRQLKRTKLLKEELMMKAWHPDRVSKWIEAGFEITD